MAQGYSAMSKQQMGGMYGAGDAAGWASWASQMGMAAPTGGYPQMSSQGGRAGGYAMQGAAGQASESWMAQHAQYAQYYNQQGAQGYVQQGAQAYTQQAGAGGQEGNGGMVPMAGMMSYG